MADATLYCIQTVILDWLLDMNTYLQTKTLPANMSKDEQRKLTLKALPYTLQKGILYRLCQDQVLQMLSKYTLS
jgi:hypothetical protein